jgi:protein-tyrosine phosphatase
MTFIGTRRNRQDAPDANEILPGLWQGAFDAAGVLVHRHQIDMIVLCAFAFVDEDEHPGVTVLRIPLYDGNGPIPWNVHDVANQAAETFRTGGKVFVACAAGLNRSGLLTGLILTRFPGLSGMESIDLIQKRRPGALTNPTFVRYLRGTSRRSHRR